MELFTGHQQTAPRDSPSKTSVAISSNTWRPALRSLIATPIVTLMAVLSLALGIGANTALFSIFNSLVLRTLPVRAPAELATVTEGSYTYAIWEAFRQHSRTVFDGAFAWSGDRFDLSTGGQTDFVDGAYVSGEMFDVLGVTPARGRLLNMGDDAAGVATPAVVISHRFWQRRFERADDVVGRQITLARVPFTIVGVMPAGFTGPDVGRAADVMIPFSAEPLIRGRESFLPGRSTWWLEIMVRMKRGHSLEAATAALRGVQPQIRQASLPDWSAEMLTQFLSEPLTLAPAATGRSDIRSGLETPLVAMLAAVALVLLIACVNIANLLLARAQSRQREFSVRLALGASRWQVARILLAESVIVAATGAILGIFFAQWTGALLVQQFATWRNTPFLDLALDWRVLGYTALLTIATAVAAGVAPAVGVQRVAPNDALKAAGRGVIGGRGVGLRGSLVVLQVALSLTLVVSAGLFGRTFSALSSLPLGFTPEDRLVYGINLPSGAIEADDRAEALDRLVQAASRVPGVTGAGVSLITPVSGQGWNSSVGPQTAGPPDRSRMTWMNAVSAGWFKAMGMTLATGRDFTPADDNGQARLAIVNETFARRFLEGQAVVGAEVRLGGPSGAAPFTVIGVVRDAVYRSPREGMVPTVYVPVAQRERPGPEWSLTVAAEPGQRAAVERGVSAALTEADPRHSFTIRTFDDFISSTLVRERLTALLSTFFGALAVLLAGLGLYGLMSHAVTRRRTEIGVRMALGARPASVAGLVLGRTAGLLGTGIALGLALSYWAAQSVSTLLFRLDPRDPATFAAAAATLAAVGIAAAWLPARRASRLDPARVLREG